MSPNNSPVQPERFSGYHTGADAELPAGTPVVGIADGTVVRSGRIPGYGGLVAIAHAVGGKRLLSISGHLDPATLPPVGARVKAGAVIGELGDAFSRETDGERAHLHFALYRGSGVDLRGYVNQKSDLAAWGDPVAFFRSRAARD